RFQTTPTTNVGLSARAFQTAINPVYHFTDRDHRVRPYLTAGVGLESFHPLTGARTTVSNLANPLLAASLSGMETSNKFALNYGGGIKIRADKAGVVGLRFDVRGLVLDQPRWGLSKIPSNFGPTGVYVPNSTLWGLQPTAGINFWFGGKAKPVAVVPPPP